MAVVTKKSIGLAWWQLHSSLWISQVHASKLAMNKAHEFVHYLGSRVLTLLSFWQRTSQDMTRLGHSRTCGHKQFQHEEASQSRNGACTRHGYGRAHHVPAVPSDPSAPKHYFAKIVAWVLQQENVGDNIEDKVEPLHSALYEEKSCISFSPRLPEAAGFDQMWGCRMTSR